MAEAADEEGAADAEEAKETPAAASADEEEAAGVPPVMELDVHETNSLSFARDDARRCANACASIWPPSLAPQASLLNLFQLSVRVAASRSRLLLCRRTSCSN